MTQYPGIAERLGRQPLAGNAEAGGEALARDFAEALLKGLSQEQKSIPCRFFYDARGSRLFEEITRLPEYYPTRTETAILRDCAPDIAQATPAGSVLIEFGSGSSLKTEILLEALDKLYAYVPVDISAAALTEAKARLEWRFPAIAIRPLVADFSEPVKLNGSLARRTTLGFFPGSTIGNLGQDEAVQLLKTMRRTLGSEGRLIIGADLQKDEKLLLAAYNDSAGVTAAFNRNILEHANRVLGTAFDPDGFTHLATYDRAHGRIDMYLVSRRAQAVRVNGRVIRFREGERIHTEHSHKYSIDGFQELAQAAGWRPAKVWTDAGKLFSVHELQAATGRLLAPSD